MRKIIIVILILLIILFSSIIIVDERQNAVITNYKNQQTVVSSGIHIIWPILDRVSYVFINERTSLLTLTINESKVGNTPLELEVLINYHVINPVDYLSALDKQGKDGISKKITDILEIEATTKVDKLADVNWQAQSWFNSNDFAKLGIHVDRVSMLGIKFINKIEDKHTASMSVK